MKVVVFGGSGRIGRYVVAELVARGHSVVNADRSPPPHVTWLYDQSGAELYVHTDLSRLGDVVSVLRGADGLVQLAAIPNPTGHVPGEVFHTNMVTDFNVLEAADLLGIAKLVMSSSINALGASFNGGVVAPRYFPVDEEHETRCEEIYSTTKWLGEELAAAYARRREVQIASLRYTWVMDEAIRARTRAGGDPRAEQERGAKGFWSWVDIRDVASSCRLALEASWQGHERFWINAADTILDLPTSEALAKWYPGVPLKEPLEGYAAVLSIAKARRMLNWQPAHSWH
ncbi:MAG: NAD(P)-dependent oxidoreductase [Spirochaetaceae bacterium]|nr:NAD(P)-dependent oxidoreductase [Spirochaetaceae bacterium]